MAGREETRVAALRAAQQKAETLFSEVETRGLVRPGIRESELNQEVYDLAREMLGISTYWHKRIVRAGRNTLLPCATAAPQMPSVTGMRTCSVGAPRNGPSTSVAGSPGSSM